MKTKHLFASIIMLIVSFSGIFAQNLIQNGGFEENDGSVNCINPFYNLDVNNWLKAQGTPQVWIENVCTNVQGSSPHRGNGVAYMTTSYSGTGGYCYEGIFQNVDLQECKVYTISFWVRNPETPTLTDFYINAANGLYNNSNNFCNQPPSISDYMVIYHGEDLATDSWHYFSTTFNPNKDYDQLWIYPRHTMQTSTGFTIDDIVLEEVGINSVNGDVLCYNNNYTFNVNNPSDASVSVTWQAGPYLSPTSGSGFSFTVYPTSSSYSGESWVKATISVNGCSSTVLTKTIWVGKPGYDLNGPSEIEVLDLGIADINYYGSGYQGVSNVSWTRSGAIASVTGSTVIGRYRAGSVPGYGNIYANVTNACGSVEKNILIEVTGGWHMAYPNPSNDILTVELDQEKMPANLKSKKVEVRLYDKMANLKKTKSFYGVSTTLNMNGLKSDVYLLQIKIEDKIVEEKIIVSEK